MQKFINSIFIFALILTIFSVFFAGIILFQNKADFVVKSNGKTYSQEFKGELSPGGTIKKVISVKGNYKGKADVVVWFTDKEGILSKQIEVKIGTRDSWLDSEKLQSVTHLKPLSYKTIISNTKANEIIIQYSLPEELGNEIYNTDAKFTTKIRIDRGT